MKIKLRIVIVFCLIVSIVCCDRPECHNNNSIFEAYTPDSKIYKEELINQLQKVDKSKLTYWLKDYKNFNDKTYLYFYIQGNGLCATLPLKMEHWKKLENVRDNKGSGRFNAEFTKLEYKIIKDSISPEFVYVTFDRIID